MQSFLGLILLFYVQFALTSTSSDSRTKADDGRKRRIEFAPLDSNEPINNEGEAIAYFGLRIASCIGKSKPLSCLFDVIKGAHERNNATLLNLLDQPALLKKPPDEFFISCLGMKFLSRTPVNTISGWLNRFSLQAKSFYELFEVNDPKFSFEMLAVIDVIGLTARIYPPLAKYLGIARPILSYAKSQKENEIKKEDKRKKSTTIHENKVDSIVAYLGGGCKLKVHYINQISLKEWKGVIMHLLGEDYVQGNNQLCTMDKNEDNHQVMLPKRVPIQTILKGVMSSYNWQNSFEENWSYEVGLVIPGLVEGLKRQLIIVNDDDREVQNEITNIKSLNVKYMAKLLYGWNSNIQDFMEVLQLLHRPCPSFNSGRKEMCETLTYSTLFYALPDRAKQIWLWGLVKGGLVERKNEKDEKGKGNGEMDQSTMDITLTSKYFSTTRVEMYQQGIKACGQQKADQNILSLLKMIDENRVEVIGNQAGVPLFDMFWSLNDHGNSILQFKSSSKIASSGDDDNSNIDGNERFQEEEGEDENETIQEGESPNSDILNIEIRKKERDEVPQESKKNKKGCQERSTNLDYKVYILSRGLIHAISPNANNHNYRPLTLSSGDLLVISNSLSHPQLDELARAWFQSSEVSNDEDDGILPYMLSVTLSTAIRVV